jgi:hypothetical protein
LDLLLLYYQLEKNRPKLVKVRPTASKQNGKKKFDSQTGAIHTGGSSGNNKIAMLRNEAIIQTGRLHVPSNQKKKASFGDAVAFAAITKKGMAHKRKVLGGTIKQLPNGKRMKVPSSLSTTKGTTKALPLRQFASKFKTSK